MESSKTCLGLLRRRQCVVPTLRGWIVLALSFAALTLFALLELRPFLARGRGMGA